MSGPPPLTRKIVSALVAGVFVLLLWFVLREMSKPPPPPPIDMKTYPGALQTRGVGE